MKGKTGLYLWLILAAAVFVPRPALSQAPTTIVGDTFGMSISSGTPPFASSGAFLFVPANSGDSYQTVGIFNTTSSTGTYSYGHSGSMGSINLDDSNSGTIMAGLTYSTADTGTYSISAGGGAEMGSFNMYGGTVFSSVVGKSLYCTITAGASPFATDGTFVFTAAPSGNGFTTTALSGDGTGSDGTYSYSTLNTSVGQLLIDDANIGAYAAYFTLSNSYAEGFAVTQSSSGGYQLGTFVAVNPAVAITSPTTGSTYNAASNTVNLSGSAADNIAISAVTWTNSQGGSGTASGTTAWSVNGIGLQSGTNIITVTATDLATVSAKTNLTVVYMPANITPPTLTESAKGTNVVLNWPTNAPGFSLEFATNLPATNWKSNPASPAILNGVYTETNPISGTEKFYRLMHP